MGISSWESLSLITEDKVSISGWLIRNSSAEGVLLLLHGFGTSKVDLLDLARSLHDFGKHHLVLIDFRGHGHSGGGSFSFGRKEVLDVKAVLTILASTPDLRELPIGCLGVSMGGAIGILAASHYPEIRAVVSDSAYADLGKAIARALKITYHIPLLILGQIVIWSTEVRLGCKMAAVSPMLAVPRIAPRSVMIIHGTNDKTVPHQDGQTLFKVAGYPKKQWMIPGAEHVACFYKDRAEYTRMVSEFFRDGFLGTA